LLASMLLLSTVQAGSLGRIQGMSALTISLQNLDPNPAISGEHVEVRMAAENIGDIAAENAVLELVPEYPFSMVSGFDAVQPLGTLGPYQGGDIAKIAKFNINIDKDATAGTYSLKVMAYAAGDRDHAPVFSIPVDITARESAEVIYIDKTELIPGQESDLKFTINNVGKAPLRDLTFSWSNPDKGILPVGSDNTRNIRYLDQGESVDLKYKVIADPSADTGLYSLNLDLKYLDTINGTIKQLSTTAGVYVGGGTDFDIAFSQSANGVTSFSIANTGSNPAYSVSVIVPEQPGWTVSGPNTVIIGNLNKGDYTVASYTLRSPLSNTSTSTSAGSRRTNGNGSPTFNAGGNAGSGNFTGRAGVDTITLQIAYTDTKGTRTVVEKQTKLSPNDVSSAARSTGSTTTQQSFWSQYQWYIIIVVIVLAYIAYSKYRKAKRGDEKRKK